MNLYISIISFCLLVEINCSSDITGCGGFLKTQTPIDFSKVDVKLYSKQGTLKESSDCAPTNGYYFIPLSDKGEYLLKIEPPPGWYFEPKEVPVIFDGLNDPCSLSLDINFTFKGFSVSGKIKSRGSFSGPEGVTVSVSKNGKDDLVSTVTEKGGVFQLAPVVPGKYTVTARHPTLRFTKASVPVEVFAEGTQVPVTNILVAGFDVIGQVLSNGEPVKGVPVLLYGVEVEKNSLPMDCKPASVVGAPAGALCHVSTDSDGIFRFVAVPTGRYRVRPHYNSFQVQPNEMDVQVKLAHVNLPEKFMVKGFSVKGRVLSKIGGKSLPGVSVYLENSKIATSDADGNFVLDRMEPGTFDLTAKAENYEFATVQVKISPTAPELEPLIPSGFRVCGRVVLSSGSPSVKVEVRSSTDSVSTWPVQMTSGSFCEFLPPGVYSLSVLLPTATPGLQYLPAKKEITVVDAPIKDIEFSQLRATLRGRIAKLSRSVQDRSLTVKLKNREYLVHSIALSPTDETFTFDNIQPGTYDVEVESNLQCFEPGKHTVNVNSAEILVPTFVQTGYIVRVKSSHPVSGQVMTLKKEKVKVVSLIKGENFICLPNVGKYLFAPSGCHGYDSDEITWEVGKELPLELNAVSHDITGIVFANEQTPVTIEVSSQGHVLARLGPLTATRQTESSFRFEFTYRAKEGQQLILTPKAAATVFSPDNVELRTGSDCLRNVAQFNGERGLIIEGKINPPLAGVKVTLAVATQSSKQTQTTGTDGRFTFGPLKQTAQFELTAEKESYVLAGPDRNYNFQAHKLAQVLVVVTDNSTQSRLSNVLLSLTGGEKYRKNSITEDAGERTFHSLSPGEYFLRPMMKEYKFDPSSVIIQLKAGETKTIQLTGRRVSFSVYGIVTSLNGEPEGGVPLEVVGTGDCSNLQEEGLSDSTGAFRIRGLLPQCDYALQMKPDTKSSVYRVVPPRRIVQTRDGDVHDVRMTAFHHVEQTDVAVHVTATVPDHLKTLTLKLCKEDHPESPLHVVKLDSLAGGVKNWGNQAAQERFLRGGLLVPLPFLPKDGAAYVVLTESSLNSNAHSYSEPTARFVADRTYLALQLGFHAKVRSLEQESPRHLVVGLFLAFIALVYWQLQHDWPAVRLVSSWWVARQEGNAANDDSAASKKKGRARKT